MSKSITLSAALQHSASAGSGAASKSPAGWALLGVSQLRLEPAAQAEPPRYALPGSVCPAWPAWGRELPAPLPAQPPEPRPGHLPPEGRRPAEPQHSPTASALPRSPADPPVAGYYLAPRSSLGSVGLGRK